MGLVISEFNHFIPWSRRKRRKVLGNDNLFLLSIKNGTGPKLNYFGCLTVRKSVKTPMATYLVSQRNILCRQNLLYSSSPTTLANLQSSRS